MYNIDIIAVLKIIILIFIEIQSSVTKFYIHIFIKIKHRAYLENNFMLLIDFIQYISIYMNIPVDI